MCSLATSSRSAARTRPLPVKSLRSGARHWRNQSLKRLVFPAMSCPFAPRLARIPARQSLDRLTASSGPFRSLEFRLTWLANSPRVIWAWSVQLGAQSRSPLGAATSTCAALGNRSERTVLRAWLRTSWPGKVVGAVVVNGQPGRKSRFLCKRARVNDVCSRLQVITLAE
jgi:hypothetical protein